MKTRKLKLSDVEITVTCEPEELEIRGNAIASGDAELDRTVEDEIIAKLNGNPWVWCCVKVTARFNGFEGTAYLGGCSYESEADFVNKSGYYEDLADEALQDLNREISKTAARIPHPTRASVDPLTGKPRVRSADSDGQDECACCGGRFNASPADKFAICKTCRR